LSIIILAEVLMIPCLLAHTSLPGRELNLLLLKVYEWQLINKNGTIFSPEDYTIILKQRQAS